MPRWLSKVILGTTRCSNSWWGLWNGLKRSYRQKNENSREIEEISHFNFKLLSHCGGVCHVDEVELKIRIFLVIMSLPPIHLSHYKYFQMFKASDADWNAIIRELKPFFVYFLLVAVPLWWQLLLMIEQHWKHKRTWTRNDVDDEKITVVLRKTFSIVLQVFGKVLIITSLTNSTHNKMKWNWTWRTEFWSSEFPANIRDTLERAHKFFLPQKKKVQISPAQQSAKATEEISSISGLNGFW